MIGAVDPHCKSVGSKVSRSELRTFGILALSEIIVVTVSRDPKQERAKDIKASDSIGTAVIPSPSEPSLKSSDCVDRLYI